MAGPEHTPASGRRFLPASSSTTQSVEGPSGSRNPFSGSRSAHLPSSSFSFATPRFQQSTHKIKDDIQTSFDDEAESPLPQRGLAIASSAAIDVVDDDEPIRSPLYDQTGDLGADSHWHDECESSPLQQRQGAFAHVSKRRKVLHPGVGVPEPISVSSPPADDHFDDVGHPSDVESPASQVDLEDNLNLDTRHAINEESSRLSHFRSPASDLVRPTSKPPFKTNPGDISHGQTASGPVLPDIFSPSRRKGKKDYIHGGNADLVRSWVLAIPTQESQGQPLSKETVSIAEVRADSSGRFWIATDDNGVRWLLPHQQEKAGSGSRWSLSTLRPGAQILVKGKATRWGLNLDSRDSSDVTVAAYWEIVSPG
ncbi:hypothetical protein PV04_05032 [Phialophora macrospora]|uniref:Uncharacterized protein n=1 Tax=Phialophora macrospora TaxID=1851006 RepID=A0A0D2GAT7_9EURO|nr:hypothetical protein PV04_05032 [Phialophora macrospora]